jgi:hypothetical protein
MRPANKKGNMSQNITKISKKEIALIQIKSSARHYNNQDYISCITLAGAAEEILGEIAKKKNGFNQLENDIKYTQSLSHFLSKDLPKTKAIIKDRNVTKNDLKHNDIGENLIIEADFENEATTFFVAAIKNYFNAFEEWPDDSITINLFEFLTL